MVEVWVVAKHAARWIDKREYCPTSTAHTHTHTRVCSTCMFCSWVDESLLHACRQARRLAAPVCLCNMCNAVMFLDVHVASMRAARASFTFRLESFPPSSDLDVPIVQWG